MKIKLSNWFPGGMWILVMELVGYGSNDSRLEVLKEGGLNNLLFRLQASLSETILPVIHHFSEAE